jgi:hypothetical protein
MAKSKSTRRSLMKKLGHGLGCCVMSAALMLVTGCASTMMTTTNRIATPPEGKALVTFFRPSMFGGAIQFGIWDGDQVVGVLSANSYIQYAAQPGEHLFLARAENWSYLKAHLEAGKEYYVIGRVFPGVWKARVALDPIKKADLAKPGEKEKVEGWLKDLSPTAPMESKVEEYSSPRLDHVRQGMEEFKKGEVTYEIVDVEDGN